MHKFDGTINVQIYIQLLQWQWTYINVLCISGCSVIWIWKHYLYKNIIMDSFLCCSWMFFKSRKLIDNFRNLSSLCKLDGMVFFTLLYQQPFLSKKCFSKPSYTCTEMRLLRIINQCNFSLITCASVSNKIYLRPDV